MYPELRFLYLMGRKPDKSIVFLIDSEPIGSPDESPPGQPYPEASDALQQVFATGRAAVEGPLSDRWGTWVSALVPIRHPRTLKTYTVLGIDVDASAWRTRVLSRALTPTGFTVALVLLLIAGRALLRWRANLPDERSQARLPRNLEGLITAACGLVLTLMLAGEFAAFERHARRETFTSLAVENASRLIETLQDARDYQLAGLARFLAVNPQVNHRDFLAYTEYLTRNIVMEGWGWAPVVPAHDRERFEHEARADGFPYFSLWQQDADGRRTAAHDRDVHYPILHLTPMGDNASVLGYDLGSEPSRRTALEEAARTGLSTATDPVELIHSIGTGAGILLIEPVFSRDTTRTLRGFALGVLRIEALLNRSITPGNYAADKLHLDLYQLRTDDTPWPMGSTGDAAAPHATPRYQLGQTELGPLVMPFPGFGKVYIVAAEPGSAFADLYPARALGLTLTGGLLLTAVLAVFIDFLGNRKHVLEQLVRERTFELQTSHEHLMMERRRLAGIIEGTNAGTWEWNVQTGETVFNERWAEIVGHTLAELEPISIRTWLELVHPDDLKVSDAQLQEHFAGKRDFYDCECRMRHKDGHWVWVHHRGRVMTWTEDGKPLLMMGTHSDITERKRLETELIELATTDPLTGLPNRRSFFERLEQEFERLQRFDEPHVAVLMFDLDHFKRINDRHGHAVGDEVLVHFAELPRQRLRKTDMAGRLGGEEFAVMLLGSDPDSACRFADQFRRTLKANPLHRGDQVLSFTTSIGVSFLKPDDVEADTVLLRADTALYRAKQQGRDRVEMI